MGWLPTCETLQDQPQQCGLPLTLEVQTRGPEGADSRESWARQGEVLPPPPLRAPATLVIPNFFSLKASCISFLNIDLSP